MTKREDNVIVCFKLLQMIGMNPGIWLVHDGIGIRLLNIKISLWTFLFSSIFSYRLDFTVYLSVHTLVHTVVTGNY